MAEYKVQFDIFEGPLDLLLCLVKQQEVDIYQVDLARLASGFIEHVDRMRELDLDIAGEFLVMAATLMQIKSRELLPREERDPEQEEEDEADPRRELIRQLVEYRKFKDAAASLGKRETDQQWIHHRNPPRPDLPLPEPRNEGNGVSIFALLDAVNVILDRIRRKEADSSRIHADRFTVSEKIRSLRDTILRRGRIRFTDLFEGARSRPEVICTFLAMLELIRLHVMEAFQSEVFGEIELRRKEAAPAD